MELGYDDAAEYILSIKSLFLTDTLTPNQHHLSQAVCLLRWQTSTETPPDVENAAILK